MLAHFSQWPISFAEYMHAALYTPGLGYYSSGQPKFGRGGDFITAPELSPLFSYCIAHQCEQVLKDLKARSTNTQIFELGAGSGVMAVDLLLKLEERDCLPDEYCILELSAHLKALQRECFQKRAPHFLSRVKWVSQWPEASIRGVVVANEVLDAMPVHKFRVTSGVIQEAYVDCHDEVLSWLWKEASPALVRAVKALEIDFIDGYESEINLNIAPWMHGLSRCVLQGLVVLVDYGFPRHEYYHPERSMGTLMCHYQQRAHDDPLQLMGQQDITAHVDFTAVAEAAFSAGLEVSGFTNQASFLVNCGIANFLSTASNAHERFNWNQQMKQLTLPSEMGELFKAMALTKHYDTPLLGFESFDQLDRL